MKKTMKIIAITIAMLGLMVLENKAIAQDVSVNFRIGGVAVHYQNYNNGYYNGNPGYAQPVVYQQPYVANCGTNYGYTNNNRYYDDHREDTDNRYNRNERYNDYNRNRDNDHNNWNRGNEGRGHR